MRSRVSAGANRLLSEGCPPACDADDVLVALSLETAGRLPAPDPRPAPVGVDAEVLELLGWQAAALDDLLAATDLEPPAVTGSLARLEEQGWARMRAGWWERVAAP